MDIYIEFAEFTIKKYLNNNSLPPAQETPAELLKRRAGCFVSIHTKKDDALRGCIGTILPTCKNLGGEIVSNAVAACQDSRFTKVSKDEINDLIIQVDILNEPEPIDAISSLNPKKYGVIVKSQDGRTGLLLPDLDGVDETNYQVAIARDKAGIRTDEPIQLYRFTVERHKEN